MPRGPSWAVAVLVMAAAVASAVAVVLCAPEDPLASFSADLFSIRALVAGAKELWAVVGPGGRLHPAYFLEHKGHLVIEGALLTLVLYFALQSSFKPKRRNDEPLSEKEVNQLCAEWEPEPLVPKLLAGEEPPVPHLVSSAEGQYSVVDGQRVLNLASGNFLGMTTNSQVLEVAHKTIEKYGVGSCGPRGFYGTLDVHLRLEDDLAAFMGTEEAIVYSYDMATISSLIPAIANRMDIVIADEYVSYAIQQGITLSRARHYYFKHNDMSDLERILKEVDRNEEEAGKPRTRRFIIVEGIYAYYGDMAPLDKVVQLKDKYKYRLAVEESYSFGMLGKTGRGACEHFGLQPGQVDMICAAMSTALGSTGGFVVADHDVVDHQRLQGLGYCFSASLPPYLAVAANFVLKQLQSPAGPKMLSQLRKNTATLRRELQKIPGLVLYGKVDVSPVIVLNLEKPPKERVAAEVLLKKVADHCLRTSGIFLAAPRYSSLERAAPPPCLLIYSSALLVEKEVASVVAAVKRACKELL